MIFVLFSYPPYISLYKRVKCQRVQNEDKLLQTAPDFFSSPIMSDLTVIDSERSSSRSRMSLMEGLYFIS